MRTTLISVLALLIVLVLVNASPLPGNCLPNDGSNNPPRRSIQLPPPPKPRRDYKKMTEKQRETWLGIKSKAEQEEEARLAREKDLPRIEGDEEVEEFQDYVLALGGDQAESSQQGSGPRHLNFSESLRREFQDKVLVPASRISADNLYITDVSTPSESSPRKHSQSWGGHETRSDEAWNNIGEERNYSHSG